MNWYYAEGTQQRGPVSDAEFQQLVSAGKITDATLVWREGMAEWQPYGQVRGTAAGATTGAPPSAFRPLAGADDQGRRVALDKVNGPAIGLIVVAMLGFLGNAWSAFQALIARGKIPFAPPPGADPEFVRRTQELIDSFGTPLTVFSILFGVAFNAIILMGGLKLRRLQSFGVVIAAAILSILPCNCPACCVGIPIGIWVLVVMNSSEVRPYFD